MQGSYKIVDVLVKVVVPVYYDHKPENTKTSKVILDELKGADFNKHHRVISVELCPDNAIPEYGVFQFELGLDINEVISDLPKNKQTAISKFIENYTPRR